MSNTYWIIYLLSIPVSYMLFRFYFKRNDDGMQSVGFIMMFIPTMNIIQPIVLIVLTYLMKNKLFDFKKFFGGKSQ